MRKLLDSKDAIYDRAYSRRRRLAGLGAESDRRYEPSRIGHQKAWNASARKLAHDLCQKYGVTLGQFEKMGVIPADVQEALSGNR